MRTGGVTPRSDIDELFGRVFGSETAPMWQPGGYNVPTDVFHVDGSLVIRMDLPEVNPDEVEVTVQENTLLINAVAASRSTRTRSGSSAGARSTETSPSG